VKDYGVCFVVVVEELLNISNEYSREREREIEFLRERLNSFCIESSC